MRRPTIVDIAKAAGVSKGSVSYALNGRPGVSEATRRRILSIAEDLGWAPSTAARTLSDGRTDAIGLVIDRPARTLGLEPFFMALISGIQTALAETSTSLLLQVTQEQRQEMSTYASWHARRRVDGVLVVDLRTDDPRPAALHGLGLPAVLIGGPLPGAAQPCVWSDDASVVREVLEYLAALGHRRIARVAGPAHLLHTRTRSRAFEESAAEFGLDDCGIVHSDYSDEAGARSTRRLLSRRRPPTALMFDNDLMAVSALGVAREMGFAVPGDLSIVAWDDSPLCRMMRPPLTAVSRDVEAHGEQAVRVLRDALAGAVPHDAATPPAVMVPRASTGPPPARRS
ncbi:DNA-binding LacI/PurR family transcriptional regulator [Spinactinospora alkalitolerans]|uniref:DNA-binding LacI/PurR family transcriptional regulator n=1 Tax=Spinactinospora alkalitolerans TaxID=687207 RepID=A0A852TYK8_9ACTN|nr:LacI family DNA-binding transcriptional regulator [Spinactinospora alkalitolerans]NYE48425.1 DNA-binding LacI/PurR family transcriptional regulator [Spinactinospora alkalitolerans]